MKKQIFLPIALIISSLLMAQDTENKFRFGIKAGLNVNKIEGKSFKEEFSFNYQLGAFGQWNFHKKLGIQPEINFAQASAESSDDMTVIYDDIFLGGSQVKAKLSQLKVAGLLNIDVGPSQRVKLQLGPQWAIMLSEDANNQQPPPQEIFKKGEFSVLGGLMLQLPLVHIGGRYELGLTNINDIDEQDKWKRQAVQLFVGLTF